MAGTDQVLLAGQQLSFAVVEQQAVEPWQKLEQLVTLGVDPQIHGVGQDQLRASAPDPAPAACTPGLPFARNTCVLSRKALGQHGVEGAEAR